MYGLKFFWTFIFGVFACTNSNQSNIGLQEERLEIVSSSLDEAESIIPYKENSSEDSFSGKEVPVLCYHQIRDWKVNDSKNSKVYIIPENTFRDHMKTLYDSGYNTILPDRLMDFLINGKKLPPKPIILTFDDATAGQFSVAAGLLDKYGLKAVFFVMTVVLDKNGYLKKAEIKELSNRGHTIGSHTWDHHKVTGYSDEDWEMQVLNSKAQLEMITGKAVKYFAYPYGLWNKAAFPKLKKYGFAGAFQLAGPLDKDEPNFTIRRIIADGSWTPDQLIKSIKRDFNK